MRRARLRDRWRGLPHAKHPAIGTSIQITDPAGLLPENLEVRRLVTVVAGLNGAGKTRLLERAALSIGEQARFVPLHRLCNWLQEQLADRGDIPGLLEEAGPLPIDRGMEDAVKAIVGRDYGDIVWYALDIADSPLVPIVGDDVVPFFQVAENGLSYDLTHMGLGELSTHVLLWITWYLREEPNLVLLLDEPDAFLPPSSREILLDHIVSHAVVHDHAIVIASHSRELIAPALAEDGVLAYLGRQDARSVLTSDADDLRELVDVALFPVGAAPSPETPPPLD